MPSWKKVITSGSSPHFSTITSSAGMAIPDNGSIILGNGKDMKLYHTSAGGDSSIDVYLGDFYIRNTATDGDIRFMTDDGTSGHEDYIILDGGDTSIKLEQNVTASGDISSSGTVTAKDINIGQTLYSSSKNTDIDTGTETVATIATGSYDAAFFDYVAKNGTNLRAGTITAIHNASTVQYSEASTVDIGDTADVKLAVVETGGSLALQATVASDNWSVKTLVRGI